MRHLYQQHFAETVDAGHNLRVYSDPVETGWILYVHYCYFHVPEAKANDVVTISIETGGEDIILRSRARDAAKQGMSAVRPFHVGEHRRVYGYAPDADIGNLLNLSLCGELIPLTKWRKGKV